MIRARCSTCTHCTLITVSSQEYLGWTPDKVIQQQNLCEPVFLGHHSTVVQEGCKIAVFSTAGALQHGSPVRAVQREPSDLPSDCPECTMMLGRVTILSSYGSVHIWPSLHV